MTPPTPTRDTPAGQAYNDLRNLARRDGRDPAEYIILYALEGFLARLAVSEHAGEFVLKGGVLMAAFAARRPTREPGYGKRPLSNLEKALGDFDGQGFETEPSIVDEHSLHGNSSEQRFSLGEDGLPRFSGSSQLRVDRLVADVPSAG